MPEISFILVSWNAKDFLAECLESIRLTCASLDHEVIVVDNDSQDGSPEMVDLRFPEARVIRSGANLGFAKGNNLAIRESRGKYLCLVNPDVKLLPGCVERLRTFMEQNPKAGIVGPRILDAAGDLQHSYTRSPSLWRSFCRSTGLGRLFAGSSFLHGLHTPRIQSDRPNAVDVLYGVVWMTRREALDAVGLLDERFFMYFEDVEWCMRFRKSGWDVVYLPHAAAIHYGGASSANTPVECSIDRQRSHLLYWKMSHGVVDQASIVSLMMIEVLLRLSVWTVLSVLHPARRKLARQKIQLNSANLAWLLKNAGKNVGRLVEEGFAQRSVASIQKATQSRGGLAAKG